ncbi:MAG: YceI family protein [Ignavibacteriae bacterium]|nr:YceI family protein [Ignavibacteriota bacterium]MCB9215647.1 YceI family protein [Ignavibacteria bacterium]
MNKNTLLSMMLTVVILPVLIGCGDVGDASKAKTGDAVEVKEGAGGTYDIDVAGSTLSWKAAKVTKAHDGGFKTFSGTVSVDKGEVNNVSITIDAASIFSDTEKLDGHLKSADFFEVEKYPTAKFEASDFKKADTAGFTHMVTGNLTIKETTHGVTFPATISVTADAITAKADFIIDRQNWGITYPGMPDDLINDDVRIIFDVKAPITKTEGTK